MITFVEFPRWSPDGSKMIFSADSTDTSRKNIWILAFDGSNLTRLTDQSDFDGYGYGDLPAARHPDWQGDNKIVFSVRDRDIWTMNADGSGKTAIGIQTAMKLEIGSESVSTYNAAWSPDGSQIAFHQGSSSEEHVWVAGPGWSNLTQISNTIDDFNWANYPSWSPDGTKLCFSVRTGNNSGSSKTQIYMANSDGTGDMVRIFDAEADDSYYCTWDPTTASDKMAYDDNNSKIYVVNNSTGDGKVELEHTGSGLDWRPDGSRILATGGGGLYSIKPDGSDKIIHIPVN